MNIGTKHTIAVLLTHDDSDTRRIAAEELKDSREPAAITALIVALQDEALGVRDAATRSLMTIGGTAVGRAIAYHIADENIAVRNLAAKILMNIGASSIPSVLPYLRDPDKDVRKFAVDILSVTGGEQSLPVLLPLLKDEDENVRVAAVDALGNIGSKEATLSLCEMFVVDPSATICVAEAMRKIGDSRSTIFLLEAFMDLLSGQEYEPSVFYAITEALGAVGDRDAYHELRRHVLRVNGRLRFIVLHALIQIAERYDIPIQFELELRTDLLEALHEKNEDIMMSCIKGLAQFKDSEVTRSFVQVLGISDATDFILFVELANRPDSFAACAEYLGNAKNRFRKEVVQLLGKLASGYIRQFVDRHEYPISEEVIDRAFEEIESRWPSVDQEGRDGIIEAIFEIDGNRAVKVLRSVTADADPWTLIQVIDQLGRLQNPKVIEYIVEYLDNEDETVREAALMVCASLGHSLDEVQA
jgi:HEAT repeat protein